MKLVKNIFILALFVLPVSACTPLMQAKSDFKATHTNIPLVQTPTNHVEDPPAGAELEFITDFSISAISFNEVLSGGPPKDGIPSIDDPEFISVQEADTWLKLNEPVISVEINNEVKAYPIQILIWHEIVNDTLGEVPVLVTFCPLCNTAIVFERRIGDQLLDFGTTGRLRFSNLIMYDRETETWWQQAEGKAIVGELTGSQLNFIPAGMISWNDFRTAYPDGEVLSKETGFNRRYGQNPYVGYDDVDQPPFLYVGPQTPDNLQPTARVIGIDINKDTIAYPYEILEAKKVINDQIGGEEIVILWSPGTSSVLDSNEISNGKDVGSSAAFSRSLDGMILSFKTEGSTFSDEQTGSTWNISGQAISGKFTGMQLTPIVSVNHFWFSWSVFKPDTKVYQP